MIEVLPIQTKPEQEALCARCSITYRPESMAYYSTADDGSGEACCICQFEIKSGCGYLHDIAAVPGGADFDTLFILGRAALNFIDLCDVHEAFYDGKIHDEALISAIGFSKNSDGRYYVNMTDLFKSPCKH